MQKLTSCYNYNMHELKWYIDLYKKEHKAIGHFNISTLDMFWAIVEIAEELKEPVIIGLSEKERDFMNLEAMVEMVEGVREIKKIPVFLNADHTHSPLRARTAVKSGVDSITYDLSSMDYEENVHILRDFVLNMRSERPGLIIEGEIGNIGSGSTLRKEIESGVDLENGKTNPEQAADFVFRTGIDLLAPAVGNMHGMLGVNSDPALDLNLIEHISKSSGVPIVLHGASGNSESDIKEAIQRGVVIVHVSTEIRFAYRKALEDSLAKNKDSFAPYDYLNPAKEAVKTVVKEKIKLFANL